MKSIRWWRCGGMRRAGFARQNIVEACRKATACYCVESMERRMLLSAVASGSETRVNTTLTGAQTNPVTAMDAKGDYVVAWESADASGLGIFAQRYNAQGSALGGQFEVNTTTANDQTHPAVAMDAVGDFVVTWESQDGSGYGIYARRYNAKGVVQGGEFRVNTTTAGNQQLPSVAMDAAGDFVIAWASGNQDGSGYGIYAQRYNARGAVVGGEFGVNTTTAGNQVAPAVAMDAQGDFVVTWESAGQDGPGYGIYAQRYDGGGDSQGGEFRVNTTAASDQLNPAVAMDVQGDFVVTWDSYNQDGSGYGIYAQRYDAAGDAQGTEFQVNTTAASNQFGPKIAMDAGGDFVIAWVSYGQDGSSYGVYSRQYNAAGAAQTGETRANSTTSGSQTAPTVAMDARGDFAVAWESYGQDGSGYGIYSQRYVVPADKAPPLVAGVFVGGVQVENGSQGDDTSIDGFSSIRVTFSENLNTSGTESVTNPANWGLLRNGIDISAQISSVSFGLNAATNRYEATLTLSSQQPGGDFQLTARDSLHDLSGNLLDGDYDGVAGGNFVLPFTVTPPVAQGREFRVNTTTANRQDSPAIATDAAGDFTIVWESQAQDGSSYGIYAQRYDAAGNTVGGEFLVNTTTANEQLNPAIAMDAAGDFTIAWQSYTQDGSGYGVYAQRYDAAGNPAGGEFRVNTTTTNNQRSPSIAMDAAGDFTIAWQSYQDGSGYGIYAQRYDAAGNTAGGEFLVNTTTANEQESPAIAMDAAGDFTIAWQSYTQDGSGYGVYAQRYDAAGNPAGGEFRVNTTTASNQDSPAIAMDAAGDFTIVWQSNGQDGSGYGVYAQRYDAAGNPAGGEFRVNTTTANSQQFSAIAMDAAGDFTIAWQSSGQDGSGYGAYAQRYDAAGNTAGGEFRVNTTTTNAQGFPAIAMDAAGDFTIAWQSYGQDGSGYGVYAQRYALNRRPSAVNDSAVTNENASANVYVLANDSDPDGQPLQISIFSPPAHGTATVNNHGTPGNLTDDYVVYKPAANFFGTDSFSYQVTDTAGAAALATVSLTVNHVNQPPTIATLTASPATVNAGTNVTLTASGVADDVSVAKVTFYLETDGTPGLQTGTGGDTPVGTATSGSGGNWVFSASTTGLAGSQTFYAQATDNQGAVSAAGNSAKSAIVNVIPIHFDFGTTTSAVATGYTRASEATIFSSATGYGWLAAPSGSRDRGAVSGTTALTQDFDYASSAGSTFAVNIPSGTYNVTVTIGDATTKRDDQGIFFEGTQVDSITTAAGQFVTKTYSVTVSDGQLDLLLKDLGGTDAYAVIDGLDIVPAHYDFGTPTSPVLAGDTQVSEATLFSTSLGYGWLAAPVGSRDRGALSGTTALTQDFDYTGSTGSTFAVNLANGSYNVTVTMGDATTKRDNQGVYLEGTLRDTVTTNANQYYIKTYAVTVVNGQLTLLLKDLGGNDPYSVIDGLDVVAA